MKKSFLSGEMSFSDLFPQKASTISHKRVPFFWEVPTTALLQHPEKVFFQNFFLFFFTDHDFFYFLASNSVRD